MKRILFSSLLLIFTLSVSIGQTSKTTKLKPSGNTSFSFGFMTDIHLQPELHATEGFSKAIDTLNKLKPDFVVTGGDLVMDALGQTEGRADTLYNLYRTTSKKIKSPVYNTVGNHELFGLYLKNGITEAHPLFGIKMFESKIGKPYQTFSHKGWKFFILDDIDITTKGKYKGGVDSIQLQWVRDELAKTSKNTPVVVVLHIPLITSLTQFEQGAYAASTEGLVVANSKQVLDVFAGYNLKLVLQGHLHILEDNYIHDIHFITGGAICGEWWKGPHKGTEEGFLMVHVNDQKVTWDYIDYKWNPVIEGSLK
jgi:3',5'-cyclic-AMP phosphodiesterase